MNIVGAIMLGQCPVLVTFFFLNIQIINGEHKSAAKFDLRRGRIFITVIPRFFTMSSPSSNKENYSDGCYSPSLPRELNIYSQQTTVKSKCSNRMYRHFGISPEIEEQQTYSAPVTFIFPSLNHDKDYYGIPFTVLQDQISTVLRSNYFGGIILRSKEKTATYPVIYFSGSDASKLYGSTTGSKISGCNIQEGIYKEVRSIKSVVTSEYLGNNAPEQWKNYIVIGFKKLENCFDQTILDTWKDWTNARYIYLNIPDEMGLSQIKLYEKGVHNDINMFTHVVLIECCTVDSIEKQTALMDFVQRLRVERIRGYISIYEVFELV